MEQLGFLWTDFHENWYLSICRKSIGKIHVLLKSDKNYALFTPDECSAETVNSAEHLISLNAQSSTRPSELSERVNRNRSYLLGRVDTPTTCNTVLAHILGLSEQVSTSVEWRAHLQL